MRNSIRTIAAGLALAIGLNGAAQAEPFNIFSASKAQEAKNGGQMEQVHRRYYRRGHYNPGAAFALGAIGTIGAIAASQSYRRYCDPYYEYCGPRRVYRRHYYEPRYYAPRRYYYYD